MIRFLPETNKKEIKIEYFSRVLVFALVFLFSLSIISIFLVFPSYIISFYRDISIEGQSKTIQSTKTDTSEQENIVKITNELVTLISQFEDKAPSVPMSNILDKQNKDIKIVEISYSKENNGFRFVIKGTALTREGLLSFVKDLKSDKKLSGVNLPVSDFVKSSDINFSLTIKSE